MKPNLVRLIVVLFAITFFVGCKKEVQRPRSSVIVTPPPPTPPPSTIVPCNWPVINARLTPIGNLSTARLNVQCASAGNKILFIGGWHTGQNWWNEDVPVDIYDFSNNSWSLHLLTPADPQFTHFRFGAGVASVGNKVFIGGGGDAFGDNQSSKVDVYDASTDTWYAQQLSVDRQGLVAAAVGDKVLFAGGFGYTNGSNNGEFSTVDIYNNTTNSWSTANLSEARMDLAAATSGNKIYFAGGRSGGSVSKTVDIYDALTNSWSKTSLTNPRVGMGSIASGSEIFFAGGAHSLPANSWWSDNNNTVEILNTNTGVSTMTCFGARRNLAAVQKGDYIIFFTGDLSDGSNGTDFEIYNTATKTWSTGRLDQKIFNAAIISVNNTVYVAGGTNGNTYSNQLWKLEF